MKKRLLLAMATGFGATVLVTLIVQFIMAQSGCAVVTPSFAARFNTESEAVLAQIGLIGLIGVAFAGGAQLFEIEKWSFLKQGILHLLITAAVWVPVAWLCWMPIPPNAVWISAGGWILTYAVNWLVLYLLWRRKVREINRSIRIYREAAHEGN